MLIKRPVDIKPSEITDQRTYLDRRKFLATSALGTIAGGLGLIAAQPAAASAKLENVIESNYRVDDQLTAHGDITSYNNFYEFGTNKTDPARNSHTLVTKPWSPNPGVSPSPGPVSRQATMISRISSLRINSRSASTGSGA